MKKNSFSKSDVVIENHETAYQGFYTIDKYQLKHKKFAGGWTDTMTRELVQRRAAVGVLLFDPIQRKVVLIEQFRIGAIADDQPWLLEVVAGLVEPNEKVEDVATREVLEEANLNVKKLIPIHEYWSSPGGSSEKLSLFCGIIDAPSDGGIHGLSDEHEDIRSHVLDLETAYQLLEQQKIKNSVTIIALQWLKINEKKF